jgi:asparagine synthase (glutamine-hydrolysing)
MSGIALIYQRDGAPAEASTVTGMMSTLKHRGPNGHNTSLRQNILLGHQHFWTTPEEIGERQPLWSTSGHCAVLFDGRLDNRDELLSALRMDTVARHSSDATIILRAYDEWAEQLFSRLLGPFALVIYDVVKQRIICGRDPLGDRGLFYFLDRRLLLVASEEQALLTASSVSCDLDETTLALYYAMRVPSDGRTFFKDVRELRPGHCMIVTADTVKNWRYWDVDPEKRLYYSSDAEYAEHFRWLLDKSVERCLRTSEQSAVMMSGGLDSGSIAALAARQLANHEQPKCLLAISWIFNKFVTCDERSYINSLVERFNLRAIQFDADNDWPRLDIFPPEAHDAGCPYINPYHRLKGRLYQIARDNDVRVMLTGEFGDELYSGAEDWLLDLLLERRFSEAQHEFSETVRKFGPWRFLTSRSFRRLVGQLIDYLPGLRPLMLARNRSRQKYPPWLSSYACKQLADVNDRWPPSTDQARRPSQHRQILGMYGALGASLGNSKSNRFGIELRHPYRDRQLVEFMLAVPAHQFYRRQRYKHVLREAMANLLPADILNRIEPTSLRPLYKYGLKQSVWPNIQTLLHDPEITWRRFIQPDWFAKAMEERVDGNLKGPQALLPWRSLSLERWLAMRRGV